MPQMLNPDDKTDNIQLSSDMFSARSAVGLGSVRAVEKNGVYFYEVKILSTKWMQIGWATKECFYTDGSQEGVSDDRYSIGFDASKDRQFIWHKTSHRIEHMPRWNVGDIVGCLIDVPNKNFIFYLNGQAFDVRKLDIDVHFSDMPYYPAASIDFNYSYSKDAVQFNFGQQLFCHPPQNIEFNNFYGYGFNRYKNQWLVSNYDDENIEVSKDRFSARNTSSSSSGTVYASKPVSGQGVYFYEVKLLTKGSMKIANIPLEIGFDGCHHIFWYNQKRKSIAAPTWRIGDVLGCLIDVPKHNFIFYYKGQEFNPKEIDVNFIFKSHDRYGPAIELSPGQQVYCNFGQEPFRYPPQNIEFDDFCGHHFNRNNNLLFGSNNCEGFNCMII